MSLMDSLSSKEYLGISFTYVVSISSLYLFGFWGVFHINALEFIGLTDLVKLSIKPLLYSLSVFLIGFVVAQPVAVVLPPGEGAHTPLGQFGLRNWVFLLLLDLGLILIVIVFVSDYRMRAAFILLLAGFLGIASTHLDIVIRYLPNPRLRQAVMLLLCMIPELAFSTGEIDAHAIKGGHGDLHVDTLRSKIEFSVADETLVSYVGHLGDFVVLYEPTTDRVIFVKLKDNAPLVLRGNMTNK